MAKKIHQILSSDPESSEAEVEQPVHKSKKPHDIKNTMSKATNPENLKEDPHEEYLVVARAITHCIDLWCDVDKVIRIRLLIEQDIAMMNGELEDDEIMRQVREDCLSELSDESRSHYMRSYRKLLQMAPGLKPIINNPKRSTELSSITGKVCLTTYIHVYAHICSLLTYYR
ncbi:hypothetical protein PAXRUDRAFT_158064 [Paxillus rubicundulus Ve08.2h10]|uniref:Uncharacterized protein n=1 Tax=Paxillus rubicundulus Ve08.2h10 TaxID=930991 RepID=A0A0D0CD45_9AGAM|nr:hypothetical protein PAXRUDRAFT_158064 [Paxillus rubicundulus Ve08.2h10]